VIRGGPGAAPSREAGAGVIGTRDGPKAALSREAEAEPQGHVMALKLPRVERQESLS
jgi:hypothetical protein